MCHIHVTKELPLWRGVLLVAREAVLLLSRLPLATTSVSRTIQHSTNQQTTQTTREQNASEQADKPQTNKRTNRKQTNKRASDQAASKPILVQASPCWRADAVLLKVRNGAAPQAILEGFAAINAERVNG